jgi:Flp pilus assembly protein TadD
LTDLAMIQVEMGKTGEAEANLKKVLAKEPQNAYALSVMGIDRFRESKFSEALDYLSRSAQLDPKNAETQNYLGITLSQQGQREAAETALRKAVMLAPNYAGAHHNLAIVYATQRPPFLELARYHYNKALALGHPANPELEKQLAAIK